MFNGIIFNQGKVEKILKRKKGIAKSTNLEPPVTILCTTAGAGNKSPLQVASIAPRSKE